MSKIVIIGAGLGGLECAFIFSKAGHDVTVLEQGAQAGGCLQSFRRDGMTFDTGMHYVGGLGEGEALRWIFDYFNLASLPWMRLPDDCTDKIFIDGQCFDLASGPLNYIDALAKKFPAQKEGLAACVNEIMGIVSGTRAPLGKEDKLQLFGTSAYGFLREHIACPELVKVMAGASMRFLKSPQTLSLYEFAMINGSFIQSAWRLQGGGSQIADRLVSGVRSFGGEVLTGCRVTGLKEDNGLLRYAEISEGSPISGDIFISNVHPAVTTSLIAGGLRKSYGQRINSLANSPGVFTVNVKLKAGTVRYRSHNLHIHSNGMYAMVSFYVPGDGEWADALDILSPVTDIPAEAINRPDGLRGNGYEGWKSRAAEECIALACSALPELKGAIDRYWTSSPLTYNRFTSSPGGSAFGIVKDFRNPLATVLSPRTPIPNLLLTGQNPNLHGALGVSMTALRTCAQILGNEKINQEFNLI